MGISKEVLVERERIKVILKRKIEGAIFSREKLKHHKSRRMYPLNKLLDLEEGINFLIDNPDHVRLDGIRSDERKFEPLNQNDG